MGGLRGRLRGVALVRFPLRSQGRSCDGFVEGRRRPVWEAEGTRLFIDSGAIVARFVQNDPNHGAALRTLDEIRTQRLPYQLLFTSNFIVDEVVTWLLYERGHRDAAQVLQSLRRDPSLRTLHVTEEVEAAADMEFLKYGDQTISYTDCTTRVLMRNHAISTVFSFDHDFEIMGVARIP